MWRQLVNHFRRRLNESTIRPRLGRWSSIGCYFFGLLVAILLFGLLISLWPIANIRLTPEVDNLRLNTSLHISLDLTNNSSAWLVTGRQLQAGEDWVSLRHNGYEIYSVGRYNIVVAVKDLHASLDKFIKQNIPPDYLVIPQSLNIVWQEHIPDKSERGFTLPVYLSFNIYRRFPLADWKNTIGGVDYTEAQQWLNKQTGVKQVVITVYPDFLAKVSHKLPTNHNLIRFELDINEKTSILE